MDKTLELVLIIISAVFVLYTAAVDPAASLVVALIALVCLVGYRLMFKEMGKKPVTKKKIKTRK